MASYRVIVSRSVRKKDLARLPAKDVAKIASRIQSLARNPYPPGAVQLRGRDEWRLRQGNYRILYVVEESVVTVHVVKVGHRRDIYR
jgi:mRNA interferase RelE/StbE